MIAPGASAETHHAVPRCLLRLYDAAAEPGLDGRHIQAWLDFEHEAMRWRVPVDISRADLERLVEASAEVLEREKHRMIHASDWQRWGRRGGLSTLRRYGTDWYALLALRRWGRITAADLEAARPLR